MIKRFYYEIEQHPISLTHSTLPFLPPSTLRETYLEIPTSSSPVASLPLVNHPDWSSFPHELFLSKEFDGAVALDFSLDGEYIVCAANDSLSIWDKNTPATIRTLAGHTNNIIAISTSSDGKYIISGSHDETVQIWDFDSGVSLLTLRGHTNAVDCVAMSRDGSSVASGARDNMVRVWDVSSGECRHTLAGHTLGAKVVIFSPDGEYIVSASRDQTIRVWNAASGEAVRILSGHTDWVTSAVFTPDGDQIVSASNDMTLRVWDFMTGHCLRTIQGHIDGVYSVTLSGDGEHLISSARDGSVRVWEFSTGSLLSIHQASGLLWSVAISPDGKQIVSGGSSGRVSLWDNTLSHELTPLRSVEFTLSDHAIKATLEDGTAREFALAPLPLGDREEGTLVPRSVIPTNHTYSYTISPHPENWDGDATHTGELFEERNGEKRLACKVPLSLFWRGCKLISSGRHVVLWHGAGHLLHIDFSSTPP